MHEYVHNHTHTHIVHQWPLSHTPGLGCLWLGLNHSLLGWRRVTLISGVSHVDLSYLWSRPLHDLLWGIQHVSLIWQPIRQRTSKSRAHQEYNMMEFGLQKEKENTTLTGIDATIAEVPDFSVLIFLFMVKIVVHIEFSMWFVTSNRSAIRTTPN